MSDDALINGHDFDPNEPGILTTSATWTTPGDPWSFRTRCELRDDGTLKLVLENTNGVPTPAAVFDRAGWENLIREVDRVWKK